ncbi:MAG: peptide chain release factor 2 [Candidatus Gracilibacteria bacterium]|jgi:peptide chain release factor 2|nr:peptide chain release factor 2 [Candidatus Gracilibacteria bacterium]
MIYSELKTAISELKKEALSAVECLHLDEIQAEIDSLRQKTMAEDFWNDAKEAGRVNQAISALEKKVNLWTKTRDDAIALEEMIEMLEEDSPELSDINLEYKSLEETFEKAKIDLYLSGEFDNRDAIMEIKAGAGGTEAQDWADMLLRMYLRFAERMEFGTEILEKTEGTEAGIKSVMLEIRGPFAFGMLQSEKGTHRLVRQSPFNAKNLRQTSFAGVTVTPVLQEADADDIKIEEKDLRIDTFRASGAGGQHVNTTDSAVRIVHVPTGVTVSCQSGRSQHQNKDKAMQVLRSRLAEKQREEEEARAREVRGEAVEAAWGNQIRNYVLHPYKMIKDLRSNTERSDTETVLDGDIEIFCRKYLEWKAGNK